MAYSLVGWINDEAPAINQDNLNHMDEGIKSLDVSADLIDGAFGKIMALGNIPFSQGTVNARTGNAQNTSIRIRNDGKLSGVIYAECDSAYSFLVYAYDGDTYIGVTNADGTWGRSAAAAEWHKSYNFGGNYDYKIVMKRDDNTDIVPSEASHLRVSFFTDKELVLENKAADASIVGDYVRRQLAKTDLVFVQGTVKANSGEGSTSSTRLRNTGKFTKNDVYYAECDSAYSFMVYAYNGDTYVGLLQTDGTFQKNASSVQLFKKYIFDGNYDYKIVLRRDDNTDIIPSESSHIHVYSVTDSTLTQRGRSADAEVTGNGITGLQRNVREISEGINAGEIDLYLFDLSKFSAGKAIDSTGTVIENGTSYALEEYIEIGNEDVVMSKMQLSTSDFYHFVFFYDEEFTYLSRVGGRRQKTISASIPDDAKYFRISLTYVYIGNVTSYECDRGYYVQSVSTPKNKWYVFGDSISAGYFSITDEEAAEKGYTISYRPAGLEGVGSVWMRDLSHNYWGYANKYFLKRNLVPSAYPGQGYLKISADDNNGISKVKNTDVSDAGLITVAWGFNDWHYNMNRGTHDLIDPNVPYPTEGYDTTQITTVNQAIWFCLGELIRKAPLAKIVVQTPMNGWLYGGDWDSWWGLNYRMSNSGTLAEIHDDIKYWADYYGLQVLEMTYNNSIVNRRNIKDAMIDGSHPTDPAHMQLGRHVGIALKYM